MRYHIFASYTSDTGDLKKDELENINVHLSKYRVVLYTSTVGAGMNYDPSIEDLVKAGIEKPNKSYIHFDRIIVMAYSDSMVHDTIFQMIHRARRIKSDRVDVLVPNSMDFNHTVMIEDMKYGISHLEDVKGIVLNRVDTYTDEGVVRVVNIDSYARLHARYLRDKQNTSNNLWLSTFYQFATQRGHTVSFDFKFKQDKTTKKVQKKLNKASIRSDIVNAANITHFIKEDTTKNKMETKKLEIINNLVLLNASDKIKNEYVSIYLKNEHSINNVYRYHVGTNNNNEYDTYNDKIFFANTQLFETSKNMLAIDNDLLTTASLMGDKFNDLINEVVYSQDMINVLKNDNRIIKYDKNVEIFRSIMNRFGYSVKTIYKKESINGTRKNVLVKTEINMNSDVFKLVRYRMMQDLLKDERLRLKVKNNEDHFSVDRLTLQQKNNIKVFNNLWTSSGNKCDDVKYVKIANEIADNHKKKLINNDQKVCLIDYLDDLNQIPDFNDLCGLCDIKVVVMKQAGPLAGKSMFKKLQSKKLDRWQFHIIR